jgi:hypothetical protein
MCSVSCSHCVCVVAVNCGTGGSVLLCAGFRVATAFVLWR